MESTEGTLASAPSRREAELEARVHELEQLVEALLEQNPHPMALMDLERRYRWVNRATALLAQTSKGEMLGKRESEVFPPAFTTIAEEANQKALAEGVAVTAQVQATESTGAAYTVYPVTDASGSIAHLAVTGHVPSESALAIRRFLISEERYRLASETWNGYVYDFDIATQTFDATEGFERVVGYRVDEIRNDHEFWQERIHPEDRERVVPEMVAATEANGMYDVRYRVRHRDGSYRWVWDRAQTLGDAQGKPFRVVGTTVDVTEQVNDREKLQRKEEQWRLAAEAWRGFVYWFDPHAQKWGVTHGFEEVCGVPSESFDASWEHWKSLIHPEDLARAEEAYNAVAGVGGRYDLEYRISHSDGGWRWVWDCGFITVGAEGKIQRIIGTALDVTEKREESRRLREREEQWRLAAEAWRGYVYDWDPEADHWSTTPGFLEVTGYRPEEVGSTYADWEKILFPEDRSVVHSEVQKGMNLPGTFERHYRIVRKDGSVRWIWDRAQSLRDAKGALVRIVGTALDVTEQVNDREELRRIVEQWRMASKAWSGFVYDYDVKADHWTASEGFEAITGHSRENFPFNVEGWKELVHPEDVTLILDGLAQSALSGRPFDVRYRIRRRDGSVAWVWDRGQVYLDEQGEPVRHVGTCADVTDSMETFAKLQKQEEQWRLASEAWKGYVYDLDFRTGLWTASEGFVRVTGFEPNEIESTSEFWHERIHPEDRNGPYGEMIRAAQAGEVHDVRYRILHRDGRYRWVWDRGQSFMGDDGTVVRTVGTTVDVTEQQEDRERLRLRDEQWRLASTSWKGFVFDVDLRAGTWMATEGFEEVTGYPEDEVEKTTKFWDSLIHPDDIERVRTETLAKVQLGQGYDTHYRIRHREGEYRWVRARTTVQCDAEGKPFRVVGTTIDVTDEIAAEQRLRESQERHELAMEAVLGYVYELDLRTMEWSVSSGLERITGFSQDELSPMPEAWYSRVHPDDLTVVHEALSKSFRTPQRYDLRYRFRRADDTWIWLWDRGRVYTDENGAPARVVGNNVDATELVEAERRLRESEARYRALAEATYAAVWRTDGQGRVVEPQPQLENLLGKSFEQLRDHGFLDSVHPHDQEMTAQMLEEHLASGKPAEFEQRIQLSNGIYRWFRLHSVPILGDDGRPIEWVGTHTDIHESKVMHELLEERVQERTRELQQASEEMAGFAYSVAHDLRSPLRAILGTSRILEEDFGEILPDEAKPLLERQVVNARHLANLIDDLLRLARLGQQAMKRQRLDITEIAQRMADAHPEAEIRVQPGMSTYGDPSLVQLLFSNLLENAVKFSPEGGTITVGETRSVRGKTFFVKDEGVGFDMEFAGKLFQPFQRLHRQDEFPGTGIGLANVHRIVSRHGGTIWAESTIGRGTTFFFTLPERQARRPEN